METSHKVNIRKLYCFWKYNFTYIGNFCRKGTFSDLMVKIIILHWVYKMVLFKKTQQLDLV